MSAGFPRYRCIVTQQKATRQLSEQEELPHNLPEDVVGLVLIKSDLPRGLAAMACTVVGSHCGR